MKVTEGYAIEAVLSQLQLLRKAGSQHVYFGALATHSETDEDCTFGDLIEPALQEFEVLNKAYVANYGQGDEVPPVSMVDVAKKSLGIDTLLEDPEMERRANESARRLRRRAEDARE